MQGVGDQRHAEQRDAPEEGEGKAQPLGQEAAVLRHAFGYNRQENDVVDSQHDLQEGQCQEAGSDVGIGKPFEHEKWFPAFGGAAWRRMLAGGRVQAGGYHSVFPVTAGSARGDA